MFQGRGDRIGDQNEAYRKGLVLGLTMAELCILIIFVLLLLLDVLAQLHEDGLQAGEVVPAQQLAQLRHADSVLQEVAEALGMPVEETVEDFTRLVRVVQEAAASPNTKEALEQGRSMLAEMRQAREELTRVAKAADSSSGEETARQVEQQSYRIANQEGQLSALQKRLAALGGGKGERPCWAEANGSPDYLYDVVLASNGIKMRERLYANRARERELLPLPVTAPDEALSEEAFMARTAPLFQASRESNCRFFVVVYDATAAHEKPKYKRLLQTVENHFYKYLSNDPAPF